ncbi:NAD(P)H-hydrate dehydratase [Methanocaldococcus indicus]|uniref:NAD(P)H-hydrate dehydratase n=1 Tax=Methanocaldococcus indicus TaxID=213231 RepID=UPI003C6D079A
MELFFKLKEKIKEKDVITPKEMAIIDDNAEYLGVSKLQLMENAGKAVYDEIKNINKYPIIFCGTGNNGGDGFVVARFLNRGEVILLGKEEDIKTYEARENFKILKNLSIFGNIKVREVKQLNELEDIFKRLEKDDILVVDAMLGTGVRGELREPYKTVVEKINLCKEKNKNLYVVSVDIETGDLKSDLVVTFHKKKTINKKEPVVKEIGIPKEAEYIVGFGDLRALNKERGKHKGKNGKVLIVGGSKDYFGAPILSGLVSLKFVDLVGIFSVKKVIEKIENPQFICYSVDDEYLSVDCLDYLLDISKKYDVIVLGNGLGINEKTKEFVNKFLEETNKKVVIDADAIKMIDYEKFEFEDRFIFTPHKKEFEYIKFNIEELYSTILLKGEKDIIFNCENIKINITGNSGLTKGGTGDVLAGLTGSLFVKNDAFLSACCSAFILGYAGDLLLKEKGYNYTTLEVIEKIPNVIKLFM